MNRLFIGLISVLALTSAAACTGASEEETETSDSAETEINSGYAQGDKGTQAVDAWGRPIEQRPTNPGAQCPGCGPVPDPWKSMQTPPSNPWHTQAAGTNTGSSNTGTNTGTNGKP